MAFQAPAQQPLPHPAPAGGNWDGFTAPQLVDNLRVATANKQAWGSRPVGGFQGGATPGQNERDYEACGYSVSGLEGALTKLWHAKHGQQSKAPSAKEWLAGATL